MALGALQFDLCGAYQRNSMWNFGDGAVYNHHLSWQKHAQVHSENGQRYSCIIYTYIYTHTYIYIYIHIHSHMYTYTHNTYIHTYSLTLGALFLSLCVVFEVHVKVWLCWWCGIRRWPCFYPLTRHSSRWAWVWLPPCNLEWQHDATPAGGWSLLGTIGDHSGYTLW